MAIYRRAENSDARQLAILRWGLRTDDAPDSDAAAKARFIEEFSAWMNSTPDNDLVHWVAEQDGELIGVISTRIIHKMPSPENLDDRFGYVTNTYVTPQHRNAGVGTRLLAAVRRWAAEEYLEILVVWPSDRAYSFYERGGYARHPDPVVLKLRDE